MKLKAGSPRPTAKHEAGSRKPKTDGETRSRKPDGTPGNGTLKLFVKGIVE